MRIVKATITKVCGNSKIFNGIIVQTYFKTSHGKAEEILTKVQAGFSSTLKKLIRQNPTDFIGVDIQVKCFKISKEGKLLLPEFLCFNPKFFKTQRL